MQPGLAASAHARRWAVRLAGALGIVIVGATLSALPAAAATLTVCNSAPADFTTITAAVAAAAPNDTITVCAGTFPEPAVIPINIPLTLQGAQAGVDARTRSGPETVLDSTLGGFQVLASGTVIDGFSFVGQTQNATLNSGLATFAASTVVNNIFRDNVFGVYLNSSLDPVQPPPVSTVRHNLFDSNNNISTGGAAGNGIYSDSGLLNAVIDENLFVNNQNAAMVLNGSAPGVLTPTQDLTITNNDGDNRILLIQVTNATVTGNRIISSITHGLELGGASDSVTALDNWFIGATGRGVEVTDFDLGANTNLVLHGNCIAQNQVAGLEVDPGVYTGVIDATGNWWGATNGPAATTSVTTAYQAGRWVDTTTGATFDDDPAAGWGDPLSGSLDSIDASGFLTAPTASPCPVLPSAAIDVERTVTEGDSGTQPMTFGMTQSGTYYLRTQVQYTTVDGTAVAPGDYLTTSGTITVDAGSTAMPPIVVPIVGDLVPEPTELFTVPLSAPINLTLTQPVGTGIILDNDAAPPPPPPVGPVVPVSTSAELAATGGPLDMLAASALALLLAGAALTLPRRRRADEIGK